MLGPRAALTSALHRWSSGEALIISLWASRPWIDVRTPYTMISDRLSEAPCRKGPWPTASVHTFTESINCFRSSVMLYFLELPVRQPHSERTHGAVRGPRNQGERGHLR